MTENKKDRTVTIAVVAGIIALLLGLCLGAVAGGIGGYFIGRGAAPRAASPEMPRAVPVPRQNQTPQLPTLPQIPRLPGLAGQGGALVQEVVAGSPAENAGLQVGDIVTQVNTTPIDATHRLSDVLATSKPGDQVTLTLSRNGAAQKVDVKLGTHPSNAQQPYLGVRYSEMTSERATPTPKP